MITVSDYIAMWTAATFPVEQIAVANTIFSKYVFPMFAAGCVLRVVDFLFRRIRGSSES